MAFLRRARSEAAEAYRRGEIPPDSTPWREAPYAVVDLETTGLDPLRDEIISFASVPVDRGRVVIGEVATAIVRPRQMPQGESIRIHGLRRADLDHAPPLADALDLMLGALTGRVLVAHAAWVESGFLSVALKSERLRLRGPVLDTARLALRVPERATAAAEPRAAPVDTSPGLSRAAWAMGLPVHRPHHADGDALTTAQLFIALATRLDRFEPQTVGSLARLSEPGGV
jgi:DNA polymerase-3 subunit epsilon